MEKHGIHLVLNNGATGFQQSANGSLEVLTESGEKYSGDVVVMGIGVRPESWLAKEAGLEVGERGGIRVDEQMIARQFARLHWIMWKAGMKGMWDRMD
jgi:NADPH-dependent 2,4-dienoyl-CoA reductase/sulfur reductase-like enzyme